MSEGAAGAAGHPTPPAAGAGSGFAPPPTAGSCALTAAPPPTACADADHTSECEMLARVPSADAAPPPCGGAPPCAAAPAAPLCWLNEESAAICACAPADAREDELSVCACAPPPPLGSVAVPRVLLALERRGSGGGSCAEKPSSMVLLPLLRMKATCLATPCAERACAWFLHLFGRGSAGPEPSYSV